MLGRKILPLFFAVAASLGVSCSLNPQPEPPSPFGSRSTDDTNGGQNGDNLSNPTGSVPIVEPADAGVSGESLDASAEHTSNASSEAGLDMKSADGGIEEGGDAATDSSSEAAPDGSEGGATSSD
jgi:hypothetical protein